MKHEEYARFHLLDLARQSERQYRIISSDFLTLEEQARAEILLRHEGVTHWSFVGGLPDCERKCIAFGLNHVTFEVEREEERQKKLAEILDLQCLSIQPRGREFVSIGHRDYLGAVMGTGLERKKIGDLWVEQGVGYCICHAHAGQYLQEQTLRIRHLPTTVQEISWNQVKRTPCLQRITGVVSSLRLDQLMAVAFHTSRSKMQPYLEQGAVFLNGKSVSKPTVAIEEGALISVRGWGKFRYCGISARTKKGKCVVVLDRYIDSSFSDFQKGNNGR